MTMTTKSATKSRDEIIAGVVEYENAMREGAESEKSAVLQNAIDQDAGAWGDSEFRAFVDSMTLKSLFFSESWVFIICDLVAMKIASLPLNVMTGEVKDGQFVKRPAEGHPLQDLLENPNPFQAYSSWMYCMVVDLVLLGNAVLWYASQANYLMLLPAETVGLDIAKDGKLLNYNVTEGQADGGKMGGAQTKFAVEDITHLRRPNPSSLLWGLSPFIPGRKSVLFNRYSQDYLNSFYQKGAMPGFALEMDKDANERVAMRLLRSFENAYTGRKNMRRTLVLPKGVSLKEVSHSLANQDLATYIDKNREDIINLLKVPKHELSLATSGSLGSEEAKTSIKNFWAATLIPMMKIIEGELTKFFLRRGQLVDKSFFLEFDVSSVDALQEDAIAKATQAEKLLKTHTLNEVRKELYNLPAVEGGDAVLGFTVPMAGGFNPFQLGIIQAPPTQLAQLPAATQSAAPEENRDATGSASKAAKEKISTFLKSGDGWWSRREAHAKEAIALGIGDLERATLKMFADMAVTIIKTVKSHLKEKDWDSYRTKADERAKLVGKEELRRKLRRSLDKFEDRWIDDTRKALLSKVDVGYGVALELPFNMPSAEEIAALKERGASVRKDALDRRSSRAFDYINETTVEGVYSTIDKGIDAGKTVQEIAGDLRSKFSDIKEIGSRAMTIARTEVLTAVSLGQGAAMRDAAKLVPDLMKMWISADDDRVRETHVELHGDVVPHDEEFKNGLQFPRDPSGPGDEVINCRCTWIMVPKDQMASVDPGLRADEES
jgi:HK97 family phage portal protein